MARPGGEVSLGPSGGSGNATSTIARISINREFSPPPDMRQSSRRYVGTTQFAANRNSDSQFCALSDRLSEQHQADLKNNRPALLGSEIWEMYGHKDETLPIATSDSVWRALAKLHPLSGNDCRTPEESHI